jgi:hypothetical protein
MSTEVAPAPATPRTQPHAIPSPRRRFDWFELAIFGVFAALSVWVLALDVYHDVARSDLVWTGTDGLFLNDQMQYLAWIQDASKHFLASDMFVLRGTPHDYFQPVIVISAGLHALGVASWLALLLWKPVAVIVAFLGVRAFINRTLSSRFDRRVALVLALFFAAWGVVGDEWMPFWTWGYPFGLLAIAAVTGALVSYDRARAERRFTWIAPILGVVASFTHPWQGELMILIVLGAELVTWRRHDGLRRLALPAATIIATALPLLYYEALYRFDPAWHAAQQASRHEYSLSGIIVPLLPLLIVAALAYRRRPRTFIDAATRVWLFAALAIFGLSQSGISGTPLHAFDGITIPLAVLAVEGAESVGFRRLPAWRLVAVALVAAATIPGSVSQLKAAKYWATPEGHNANFIFGPERQALDYLASNPQPGGVLARATYLGLIVPAETGRRTYVGGCLWSEPHCVARIINTRDLFSGAYSASRAQAYVRSTGARFLLKDCYSPEVLPKLLGSMIVETKRFGCASVYQVSTPS